MKRQMIKLTKYRYDTLRSDLLKRGWTVGMIPKISPRDVTIVSMRMEGKSMDDVAYVTGATRANCFTSEHNALKAIFKLLDLDFKNQPHRKSHKKKNLTLTINEPKTQKQASILDALTTWFMRSTNPDDRRALLTVMSIAMNEEALKGGE